MTLSAVQQTLFHGLLCGLCLISVAQGQENKDGNGQPALLGRWDVTVHGADSDYPSWFEVRLSGHSTFVGSYVGQFGSARPISEVEHHDGTFRFEVPPQWEGRDTNVVYEGHLEADGLRGATTSDQGETIAWEAQRAPQLDRESPQAWSEPMPLFNGKNLDGWKPQFPQAKNGWEVHDGILTNAQPGNNILTEKEFEDFQLSAEFRFPSGSNSGIYLRGRYEAQIEDNFGQDVDSHRLGGIYGFLTPSVNAAKPAGEWQTYDITLVGRRVTILLNGERVIDRQVIPGITGGALDSAEGEPGPILIQGDHGPVEFRKITIRLPQ